MAITHYVIVGESTGRPDMQAAFSLSGLTDVSPSAPAREGRNETIRVEISPIYLRSKPPFSCRYEINQDITCLTKGFHQQLE